MTFRTTPFSGSSSRTRSSALGGVLSPRAWPRVASARCTGPGSAARLRHAQSLAGLGISDPPQGRSGQWSDACDSDAVPGVVHVAPEVPQWPGLVGLDVGGGVQGTGHDVPLALFKVELRPPQPPGRGLVRLEQLRAGPALPAVDRDVDTRDPPRTARGGVALDGHRSGGDRVAIAWAADDGVD